MTDADLAGNPRGTTDPRTPLAGAAISLVDLRLGPPPSSVVMRLSGTDGAVGLGFIEARDAGTSSYEELATFVIAESAQLVPGLTYKPSDSA